jgi:hypothetical protein
MKKILITLVLLLSFASFSQNGINRNTGPVDEERQKEAMEKARKENIEKTMQRMTEDLQLNDLQVIAIKQIYTENSKKQGIIIKKEISDDDKIAALKSLSESTEKKVLDLLDADQKEKFELLKVEKPQRKKSKKKVEKKESEK